MASSICSLAPLESALLPNGFCAGIIPVTIEQPRSIVSSLRGGGDSGFLALERGTGSVVAVEDLDGDGIPETKKTVVTGYETKVLESAGTDSQSFSESPSLNHGLAITSTHLYASQSTHVYRWPYLVDTMNVSGDMEIVIENINANGQGGAPFGHTTRTLAIPEDEATIYVSVGSDGNIDPNSFRSRIRRFSLTDSSQFPLDFVNGEVFVDGLRNEVGLTFDAQGILWGVGNSADRLVRDDLGGDIHNDNPAEEMHKLMAGENYGYPFCWREYELELGLGRGTTWAWPTTMNVVTDEQCRTEYDAPIFTMPAHSAPLGIEFYKYPDVLCEGVNPFPQELDGFAFVAYHGSWNRDIPTGYKVVYIPVDSNGQVVGETVDLLAHNGTGARWSSGVRPVDVSFDGCGRLLVTSDGTRTEDGVYFGDMVIRIESSITASSAVPNDIGTNAPMANGPISGAPTSSAPISSAPISSAPISSTPISISSAPISSAPVVATSPMNLDVISRAHISGTDVLIQLVLCAICMFC